MTLGSNSFPFVATLLIFCLFIRLIRMPEGEMRRAGCSLEGRLISLPTCNTHYTLLEPDSPKLPQSTPGSLVVIVHGYSGDVSHTIALGRELRRAGYRVLLYDLVGRGYSSCRNYDHTASLFVSQLCELLLALELNEQRLHLVGISLGGGVCAEYAKYFPKNVASMTLIASVGLPLCSSVHILTKLPLLPDFLFRFAPQHTLVAGLEHEWADSQNLKYDLMLESYMARVQSEPAFARSMLSTARHFPLEGLENTFRRVGRMFDKSVRLWRPPSCVPRCGFDR
ncbi:Alpha/Beta hydrolase protein [Pelagophyceae sp. CCMP2097]|nr:Alpha/Beta hydrolase protein [Pelagophyceae sp. CCMP2097]